MDFPLFVVAMVFVFSFILWTLSHRVPRIAFITYCNRGLSPRPYVKQTVPCDFICFTNQPVQSNGWSIDATPYQCTDYKHNFQQIPRLGVYDIIVWVDATVEIKHPKAAEIVSTLIDNGAPIVAWEHEQRKGKLSEEVKATRCHGTERQYEDYLRAGYHDDYFKQRYKICNRENLGVWTTCFVAFDNKSEHVKQFLRHWYLQTLTYTTQDQVSFPFSLFVHGLLPYTFPEGDIRGNSLFIKY
jgi:hypothetical protein